MDNVFSKILPCSWNKPRETNKQTLNPAQNEDGEEDCTNKTVHELIHTTHGCEDITKRDIELWINNERRN